MIKNGSKVKDMITGFEGIVTGRTEYLYGCSRVWIEPEQIDKDGKPIEGAWFDEQRVEVLEERKPPMSKDNSATTGGPQNDPVRKTPPVR